MITVWLLLVLQSNGVYSNRVVHGWEPLGTFPTYQSCYNVSKQLANDGTDIPDMLGVSNIIRFECVQEVIHG